MTRASQERCESVLGLDGTPVLHVLLLRWLSSLCWVQEAALVASDITLCDAVFVLLRVVVGHKSECSAKAQCNQAADSDAN